MSAPFGILGIDHVVLRAADPAALERFYVDVHRLQRWRSARRRFR